MSIRHLLTSTKIYKKYFSPIVHRRFNSIIKYKKECFEKYGFEMLSLFVQTMRQNDIDYWLEFGTLLGAYRDNGFIKGDFDLDFGVHLRDAARIYEALTLAGFILEREYHVRGENGLEQTYSYNGATFDIFYFYEDEISCYCNSFYHLHKKKFKKDYLQYFGVASFEFEKFDLMDMKFFDCSVKVPCNIERHIIETYGKGYKIPDPSFRNGFNKTIYPLTTKIGYGFMNP